MIPGLPLAAPPHHSTRPASGPESVSTILKSAGITQRRLNKLHAIAQIHQQRNDHKREKAYSARPFVLCGIPVRRPAKSSLEYSRQNGRFRLRVIGHPDYGLPTVRADCTCALLAFWMGRNLPSLPPAAGSAIRSSQETAHSRRRHAHSARAGAWYPQYPARVDRLG